MITQLCKKYSLSSDGYLIKHAKDKDVVRRGCRGQNGYFYVTWTDDLKVPHSDLMHRLVRVFLSNPGNLPQVHHKNRKPEDNSLANLEWVSKRDNLLKRRKWKWHQKRFVEIGIQTETIEI